MVAGPTEIARFAASANCLDPTEDLFDPLAPALALAVAVMPRRPAVDSAAPPTIVLGHPRSSRGQAMRGHTERARIPDEVGRVIGAVGAQRGRPADPASSAGQAAALQHLQRRLAFGVAVGLGQFDVNHQTVPILC